MLTELALLPSVFEADSNTDPVRWKRLLDKCNTFLGMPNLAPGFVVSDLYGGSWQHEIPQRIKDIHDQSCRRSCQDLLNACVKLLVNRPGCLTKYPEGDQEWAQEAHASHVRASIDRILVADGAADSVKHVCPDSKSFGEVEPNHFWNAALGARALPMDMQQQVQAIGRVLLHSQWIAIKDPHALSNGEDFVVELFKQACARPREFGPVRMEVHTQALDSGDQGQRNRAQFLATRFRPWARAGDSVDLYFWSTHFIERHLIGGAFTSRSGCQRKKKRWCISMTHTAWSGDRRMESATFSLVTGEEPGTGVYERFVAEDAPGKPEPYRVI
jgi:hypothetical protein